MAAPFSCDPYEDLLATCAARPGAPAAVPGVTEHLSAVTAVGPSSRPMPRSWTSLAQAVPQHAPPAELGARLRVGRSRGRAPAPPGALVAPRRRAPDGSEGAVPRAGLVELAEAAGGSGGAAALAGGAAPGGAPAPGVHARHDTETRPWCAQ